MLCIMIIGHPRYKPLIPYFLIISLKQAVVFGYRPLLEINLRRTESIGYPVEIAEKEARALTSHRYFLSLVLTLSVSKMPKYVPLKSMSPAVKIPTPLYMPPMPSLEIVFLR